MQKLNDAFQTGARVGESAADGGAPLGMDSGEDPAHCSGSLTPTCKAAVLLLLLVKYVCMCL